MKSALVILLFVTLVSSAPVEQKKKRYDGHRVIRINPTDEKHVNALKFLHAQDILGVDFWREPLGLGRPIDIHVEPSVSANVTSFLEHMKIEWSLMIPDLQKLADEEEKSQQEASKKRARRDFSSYKRHSEIMSFIDNLAASCRDMCSTEVIGKSSEGRDLKLIKIGTSGTNKPAIWIDAGYHAREWIAPATAMYIAQELVSSRNSKKGRALLDAFDWYILPVGNPDGYEYSHTNDRYWRKTRSPNSGSSCVGSDPNRNWDFHWGESGTSSNPCSDTYGGSKPASEIEVSTVANYIINKRSFKAYFSFHAYGQMWLTPYGYTRTLPATYDDIEAKGLIGAAALRSIHRTRYVVGSAARVLYESSGGSDDWGFGVGGCDYSYTLELRDEGRYGFALPASQIIPTGQETWAGMQAFGNSIASRYRTKG